MIKYTMINQILIEEDIEGYIDFGAPIDEYESEANIIFNALILNNSLSVEETYNILHAVWQKKFNLNDEEILLRRDNLLRAASRIVLLINR